MYSREECTDHSGPGKGIPSKGGWPRRIRQAGGATWVGKSKEHHTWSNHLREPTGRDIAYESGRVPRLSGNMPFGAKRSQ